MEKLVPRQRGVPQAAQRHCKPVVNKGDILQVGGNAGSIRNAASGSWPNFFSAVAVNDQIASIGLRAQLRFFADNTGRTIDLHTGQVGDEGWFALKTIPTSWRNAGPTANGLRNFLAAGPGLGTRNASGNREALLDKIANVTPLRATGLKTLEGQRICALVYDGNISMNYGPLNGSLKGANLGIVAFQVGAVNRLTGASSSSLPRVTLQILDAVSVCGGSLALFANAPTPPSSSTPFDVAPPATVPAPQVVPAP